MDSAVGVGHFSVSVIGAVVIVTGGPFVPGSVSI